MAGVTLHYSKRALPPLFQVCNAAAIIISIFTRILQVVWSVVMEAIKLTIDSIDYFKKILSWVQYMSLQFYLTFPVLFFFLLLKHIYFPCHFLLPLWGCAERVFLKRNTFFGVLKCFVKTSMLAWFVLTLLFNACLLSLPLTTNCLSDYHIPLCYDFLHSTLSSSLFLFS